VVLAILDSDEEAGVVVMTLSSQQKAEREEILKDPNSCLDFKPAKRFKSGRPKQTRRF
jgi:hypothetical protein